MREFKDRDGRPWKIDLCIGNVLRVRSESCGRLDLLDPAKDMDGQPLQVLLQTNLAEFFEVLWLLVETQARDAQIGAEAFGQAVAADCLIAAQQAFYDEWHDFFHSLRRPDAAMAVAAQAKAMETAVKLVTERISQIDQTRLQSTITMRLERDVSAAFGNVQASLAAIHDPTPGDNST